MVEIVSSVTAIAATRTVLMKIAVEKPAIAMIPQQAESRIIIVRRMR
jgi:hypothetical protein